MSRKQLTVERIRKKKAASVPTGSNHSSNGGATTNSNATMEHRRRDGVDPFHNGQIPTCRLLLDAVQDIFPELQQQMKERTLSSELGQLLRWQVLKRRKERLFPPPPPLSSASPRDNKDTLLLDEINDEGTEPAASSNKKKRKKKKKKKEAGGEGPTDSSLTTAVSEDSDKGNDATTNGDRKENSPGQPHPLNGVGNHVTMTTKMTVEGSHNGPPTLQTMDQSVHELQEQSMILQQIVTPDLQALPADDLHDMHQERRSSLAFLAQIQQESTEREDDDDNAADFDVPLAPATSPETPQGHGTRPRVRARTLSSSSFASFEGVVTPTTKNTGDGNDNDNEAENSDNKMTYMASPVTHEWVPEEGAEAKTETPPGDVIKNPLDLPFLRTLCKVNGLTTTTINGSLISAEWPENVSAEATRLSSIETTKILLEDWMGQLLEHNKGSWDEMFTIHGMDRDYSSFLSYLQTKLRNGNQALGIPLSDLKNAVNEIDCITCQQDAMAIVDKWSRRGENKPIVLNPVVLQDHWLHDTSDVDTAFDYVALEEGHHLPKPDPPDEEDGEGVDTALHLSLHIAEPPLKKVGTKYLFIDQMTPKHLTSLVEHWLPSGIVEDILVETSVGSSGLGGSNEQHGGGTVSVHDHVSKLQSLVLERKKMATTSLEEIDDLGKRILEELEEIRSTLDPSRPNIEIVAYPKMKQVDERCTDLCDKILEVVLLITGGRNDAVESLKLKIWGKYLETLGKILHACDTFYCKVGQGMADQTGALPVPFVSAAFRRVFQELIEAKVHIWTEFGTFLCTHLTGRVLRELYTRSVWYLENTTSTNEQQLMTPLDEACINLVKDLASWSVTLRRGRMSEIQRERMSQTERMLEQLQAVIEPMATEYATVERFFSAERNIYFASLRSHIVLAQGVKKKMRLVDSIEVEGMTTGFLLVWAHTRWMQNRMINSTKIPPLPLQLKRWMLQDENSLTDWKGVDDSSPLNSYHQRYCHPGRQGKRRAMCIVAGLVYRWLEEQCKSWRAELAEKELLIDFEDANKTVPHGQSKEIQGSTKTTKSKKNKKKKVKNTTASNDDDSSRLGDSTSVIAHNNSTHMDGTETPPPHDGGDDEKPADQPMTPSTTLQDHDQFSDELHEAMQALEDERSIPLDDETDALDDDSHLDDSSSTPRIFVEDGNTIIAPDAFLVARMREMMLQSITSDNIITIG